MEGADGVYPASEDTYLLIDALQKDLPSIKEMTSYALCLELGCGSGEVTEALTSFLPESFVFSTDVNALATTKTQALCKKENGDPEYIPRVELLTTDLFTAFTETTTFDVIVFNPPYVPTDDDELNRALTARDIAASWAGGLNGRVVIDDFLQALPSFMSKCSYAYLVLLEENHPQEVATYAKSLGLSSTVVHQRRAGIETLYIMRFHII